MKQFIRSHSTLARALLFSAIITLLLVAQTALWLNRTIFDNQKFTAIATSAITAESSRKSIGEAVVQRVFEDRPALRSTIGPRMVGLISGLLGTDFATSVTERIVQKGQLLVTTPRREPIVVDLTGLKDTLTSLQATVNPDGEKRLNPENIPDEIMLIDTSKIPNFYTYGVVVLWLGPISLLLAVGLMAWWVYRGHYAQARMLRLRIVSGVVLVSGLLALLIGPLVRAPFLSLAETAQSQTVLRNLFEGFIAPFNAQARTLSMIAVFALAVSYLAPFIRSYLQQSNKESSQSKREANVARQRTIKKEPSRQKAQKTKKK